MRNGHWQVDGAELTGLAQTLLQGGMMIFTDPMLARSHL